MSLQEARINWYSTGIVTDIIIIRPSRRFSVRQKKSIAPAGGDLIQRRGCAIKNTCWRHFTNWRAQQLLHDALVREEAITFFGYHKDMIKVTFCINSYRKYTRTKVLVFLVYTAYQNTMIENWQTYCVSEVTTDAGSVSVRGKYQKST